MCINNEIDWGAYLQIRDKEGVDCKMTILRHFEVHRLESELV